MTDSNKIEEKLGPLSGYRILEFGTNVSVPFAAMLLGDQGADVIKVETTGGDQTRGAGNFRPGISGISTYFMNVNRNKRSIVVNLKSPEGKAAILKLASQCDVIIQNYRPGVADRLGIGYEAIRALRPDIIYVSVDGMGSEGLGARRRTYDIVIQGMSGFAATQAPIDTGEPTLINNSVTDKITALNVWQGTTAALLHRERTGQGQHLQVSMLDAALSFLWPDTMGDVTYIGGEQIKSASPADIKFIHPTQDSHIIVGIFGPDEWAALCTVIGREDLILDPRYATLKDRLGNIGDVNAILSSAFLSKTTTEWVELLDAADAVYAPVNKAGDLLIDPVICERGILEELEHPVAGAYRQPKHPVHFSESPASIRRHAPMLGADTVDILAELGLNEA
jgi:crotonobetainyl-CoA:carnitine CoA-transferase CaiB-like acyl-CoA transferase